MNEPLPERDQGPEEFSDAHRAGLDARRVDQDRTLTAVHRLEAALSSAAPGREPSWRADVAGALAVLDVATADEQRNAAEPDSLLSDIARTPPRLRGCAARSQVRRVAARRWRARARRKLARSRRHACRHA